MQGDTGNEVYYLLEGEVEVKIKTPGGSENTFSIFKPDSFFGEMGYLLAEKRSASTTAKTDVRVLVLPPPVFEKILMHDTSLDRALIENISYRLKVTNDRLAGI